MTQFEFLKVIGWNMKELATHLKRNSSIQIMYFKKDFERALTIYSRGKSSILDPIQEKSLAIITKIEKWMRQAYIESERKALLKSRPDLIGNEMGIKEILRNRWEKYNKRMSY